MNTAAIGGIAAVILIILVIWYVVVGNSLIRLRNFKDEAWSGIDVQLKWRHDLVSNLVNSVKGYMLHEKGILAEITAIHMQALSAQGVRQTAASESQLSGSLGRLFAMMENYPDLKANQNVLKLQEALTELEDDLQKARRYYNGCVREFNNKIEMFPSSIVASTKRYTKAEFFELTGSADQAAPVVNFFKPSQKCRFCGSAVPDNMTICPSCGAKQMVDTQ